VRTRVVGGCLLLLAGAACGNHANEHPLNDDDETVAETVAHVETTAAPAPKQEEATTPKETHVVLVTIDGVRWEDMLGATPETSTLAMPNLHRLVQAKGIAFGGGGCEHDVRASGPNFVSLPGCLEIFTGAATTCTHNYCPPVDHETIVDEVRGSSRRTNDVAVFASWDRYASAVAKDRKPLVLSAGARTIKLAPAKDDPKLRELLQAGAANAGYPGWGDYRADAMTGKIALRYLETESPRFLVIGLGDADEQAHRGDIAGYRKAIARADDLIGEIAKTLTRMGPEGDQTAVLVTTDHGRAKSLFNHGAMAPESARVFVAAFGANIARKGVTCAPEDMHLSNIAGAIRTLLAIDSELEPGPLSDALLAGHDN
jgi:hypothetical protein